MSYQYEDSPSLIVKTFSFWEELGGFAMVDFLRGFHFFFFTSNFPFFLQNKGRSLCRKFIL